MHKRFSYTSQNMRGRMQAGGQYTHEGFYGAVQITKELLYCEVNMHTNIEGCDTTYRNIYRVLVSVCCKRDFENKWSQEMKRTD